MHWKIVRAGELYREGKVEQAVAMLKDYALERRASGNRTQITREEFDVVVPICRDPETLRIVKELMSMES